MCYTKLFFLVPIGSYNRIDAASVVVNDTFLWITGGGADDGFTSEFFSINGSVVGPDLQIKVRDHEMINIR